MNETLAASHGGDKPIPLAEFKILDSAHSMSLRMTPEQAERGRRLGILRSSQNRLIRKAKKLVEQANRSIEEINLILQQQQQSTAGTVTAAAVLQPTFEVQALSIGIDSSSQDKDKDKTGIPTLGGSSSRVRARVRISQADLSPGFQRFWSLWQKRVAKQDAFRAWMELNPSQDLEEQIFEAVRQQFANNFAGDGARATPYPATWLRAERWTDEIIRPKLTREQELDLAYQQACIEEEAERASRSS